MTNIVKLTHLALTAACPELPAASHPAGFAAAGRSGSALSLDGARLCGTGLSDVSALRRGERAMPGIPVREISQRPTQAPAVVVAQAHAYVAAKGAYSRNAWSDGVTFAAFAGGTTVVSKTQQTKKRAFRGLEPWRDPA